MNFWLNFDKSIIALSPMDGVGDVAFRFITAKYGKPSVITTEFISIDGLEHGAKNLFNDFLYHEIERPIVAQVFGTDPRLFYQSAKIISELGFDGMDINMGCPAKSVSSRGAGAGLIRTPKLAQEIIRESKRGVADYLESGLGGIKPKVLSEVNRTKDILGELGVKIIRKPTPIPVSVKTRIGYDKNIVHEWIPKILEENPANITLHGRTLKQMYQGEADWEALRQASQIVYEHNSERDDNLKVKINLNGDVSSPEIAKKRLVDATPDGLYIGRASYGNPWIFKQIRDFVESGEYHKYDSFELRKKVAVEHANLHHKIKGERAFVQMRKHLAWYFKSFPGAGKLRASLMQTNSPQEVEESLENFKHE